MKKLTFSPPDLTDEEFSAVSEVLNSGWITTGPKTKLFETKIAEYCGTKKAVCLNSATAGLELILRILGIGEGDEVIVPAYTYTASASVIAHVGAKIVLADCAPDSYEMDYENLSKLITKKTKAIIAVDLGGIIANYTKIYEIVNSQQVKSLYVASNPMQKTLGRIAVIADAAHSFGATQYGIRSGAIADFSSFSFHAVKNLTTAEGGAVTWKEIPDIDSEDIYRQFMLWSLHGQNKDALAKTKNGGWEYDISILGYKCNMTDIAAAIGLVQLSRYDSLLKRRKEIIEYYNSELEKFSLILRDHYTKDHSSSGHLYQVRIPEYDEAARNNLISNLSEKGVPTNVHYKPLPMMTAYRNIGYIISDFPNAYNIYRNEITLPLHTLLSDEDMKYIVKTICSEIM